MNDDELVLTSFDPPCERQISLAQIGKVAPWPPRLSFDMAMGESDERLCHLHNITSDDLTSLRLNPTFRREVAKHEKEVRDNGLTFRAKARVQAEMYLEDLHELVTAVDTPASVRLDAIKSVVKWGDLEPVPQSSSTQSITQNNMKIEIAWLPPTDAPSEGSNNRQIIDIS